MGEKTIRGSVTLDIPKDKQKKDDDSDKGKGGSKGKKGGKSEQPTEMVFEYVETKSSNSGGGPRGIDIWRKGESGRKEYAIDPNPHDNRKYNKEQSKFYTAMATAIGEKYIEDSKFPKSVKNVRWGGEAYDLS